MEVVDKGAVRKEAQEVFDIIFDTVSNLPEHLMKSRFWANSVMYALVNLLVRITQQWTTKEQILEVVEGVWDGGPSEPQSPSN